MKISGNTFIVTGGASGLGEATVKTLVEQGGNAVILDVNDDGAKRLAQELGEDRVLAVGKVDVTQEDEVAQALALAVEQFGPLAGAIICHGILGASPSMTGYGPGNALTSYDQLKYVSNVNFFGAFNVAQKVADILIKQEPSQDDGERGVIIMVTSIAGLDGSILAYGTSKAAIAGLVLPFARELAPFGIRVMGIAPGAFNTPMTQVLPQEFNAAAVQIQLYPKRIGQAQEFSSLVSYILDNVMLNGSVIRLDAGTRMSQ
ncbi:hypothetical protein BC943DRAFT_289481 [Umbelopsis sp. AD052]|nr:hypothetical protein BC943DRAFT_289481 [Umbelopsis sp. AD052]